MPALQEPALYSAAEQGEVTGIEAMYPTTCPCYLFFLIGLKWNEKDLIPSRFHDVRLESMEAKGKGECTIENQAAILAFIRQHPS